MFPALITLTAWVAFCGSHLLLSSARMGGRLARQFGSRRFLLIHSAVSTLTLAFLIAVVVVYGDQGAPNPGRLDSSLLRGVLGFTAFLGAALAGLGLFNYPRSPMPVLARRHPSGGDKHRPLRPPTAIERITRHPFFTGLAIFAASHALLADTMAGAVCFAGFGVLALVGMPLQDRKLRRRWQQAYGDFQARTPIVPLTAPQLQITGTGHGSLRKWQVPVAVSVILPGLLHPLWISGNGAALAGFILILGLGGILAGMIRRNPS